MQPGQPSKASLKSKRRERGLVRLAERIAGLSVSRHRLLTHDECVARLDFFVDAERRGADVRTLYPTVWAHVHECRRCALMVTLCRTADGDLTSLDEICPPADRPSLDLLFSSPSSSGASHSSQLPPPRSTP